MSIDLRYRRRVQFYETDAAGIVHFSWYFRYMEEAEHALWRELGLSIAPADSEIGWPRVAASFSFLRALHFEDEFDVSLRVVSLKAKTIKYKCVLTKEGTELAVGDLTVACVSRRPGEPMRAVDIPEDVAARFRSRVVEEG